MAGEEGMKKIILVLLFVLITTISFCTDDYMSRKTLKGIKKIYVEVLIPNEVYSIKERTIKTDIEHKLKRESIRVIGLKENYDALLFTEIIIMESGHLYYVANVHMEIYQYAIIKRIDSHIEHLVVTWSAGFTSIVRKSQITDIRTSINDMVDQFINDYLSVNPK